MTGISLLHYSHKGKHQPVYLTLPFITAIDGDVGKDGGSE